MSAARVDLWGELDPERQAEGVDPVRELLDQQAALLAEKTNGRLVGHLELGAALSPRIKLRFMITVPTLSNYRYELFYVVREQLDVYPVQVWQGDEASTCSNREQLEDVVAAILRSDKTRRAIGQLYVLSRDVAGDRS